MNNKDIRAYAKKKNVFFWQIAMKWGVSDPTMSRRLRLELTREEKEKFIKAIDEISTNPPQYIREIAKKYYFISSFNGPVEVTKERYENLKRQFIKGLTCSEDKIQQCVDQHFKEVDEDDV